MKHQSSPEWLISKNMLETVESFLLSCTMRIAKLKYDFCWKKELWTDVSSKWGGNSNIPKKRLETRVQQDYRQNYKWIDLLVKKVNAGDYKKMFEICFPFIVISDLLKSSDKFLWLMRKCLLCFQKMYSFEVLKVSIIRKYVSTLKSRIFRHSESSGYLHALIFHNFHSPKDCSLSSIILKTYLHLQHIDKAEAEKDDRPCIERQWTLIGKGLVIVQMSYFGRLAQ